MTFTLEPITAWRDIERMDTDEVCLKAVDRDEQKEWKSRDVNKRSGSMSATAELLVSMCQAVLSPDMS